MKKLIALVLAFIMALTLAACAANTEPAQTEQPEQTEQPAAAAENFAVVFPAPIWYNAVDRN